MVTVFPVGTAAGAVNCVVTPLAVCVALNAPHCAPPQVTLQLTPPFCVSLVTVAAMLAVPAMSIEPGGVEPCVKTIEIVG
jgi:hypothetical protein